MMTKPDISFLQKQIQLISSWRLEFQWLVDYGLSVEKAINFGCDPPGKSLGLMWAVQAEKLLGLDLSPKIAYQEETTLARIQKDLRIFWDYLYNSDGVTDDEVSWWNEDVPEFFKQEMTKHEFYIDYVARDYTKFVNLPSNFFDMAFCDSVLHQIRWDKTRQDPSKDTRFVINQMSRLVRPGGIVAAYEWVQTGAHERLDFRSIFETSGANLTVLHMQERRVDNWRGKGFAATYICQKK